MTSRFYLQIENKLWRGQLMFVNEETSLVEHIIPDFPTAPEEKKCVCHLDPEQFVVRSLLGVVLHFSE